MQGTDTVETVDPHELLEGKIRGRSGVLAGMKSIDRMRASVVII